VTSAPASCGRYNGAFGSGARRSPERSSKRGWEPTIPCFKKGSSAACRSGNMLR
jgi:hypothetical protein